MKRIAVYCGANTGHESHYEKQAKKLGEWVARAGYGLVYGGGKVGLMGTVADAALANGGEVIGVMPAFLAAKEIAHAGLTELVIVEDMHQRKRKMMDLADAYLALPGGPGTLEEISEVISWARVGEHNNPCILFDINGYYQLLAAFFDQMVKEGFLTPADREKILMTDSFETLSQVLTEFRN